MGRKKRQKEPDIKLYDDKDSYMFKELDKETLLAIRTRIYSLINAIEKKESQRLKAKGLYILLADINDAIDNKLTHADVMDFGFYPERFPIFNLL